ncbi:MAG: hypothetical protein V3R81_03555 [Gammaproteobacteria bacterium]
MKRRNVGERPTFFEDPAADQLLALFLAMSAELSTVYDRVDTLERLLGDKDVVSRDEVESYRPGTEVEQERKTRREQYIRRLFRVIREDGDNLVPHDKMQRYQALQDELKNS